MNNTRRNFLKLSGALGAGLASGGFSGVLGAEQAIDTFYAEEGQPAVFNMCGFAAPKLDTVRIGFIGTGNRGKAAVRRMSFIEGVEVKGICDLRPEKAQGAAKDMRPGHQPTFYTDQEDAWKKMCDRNDIDLIYIATPWALHTPMAVYAMQHGKHVCVEVPAAKTIEECWQLVNTSEKTKKHCIILENCCYDFFEMLTLNMARQGFFGDIVHCEGAYIHDLAAGNFSKDKYYKLWRLEENSKRNGNLYPTHGLGPVSQIMNLNRGDKMDYLVSLQSNDFMMGAMEKELLEKDKATYAPYANRHFRGNMNTSVVKTAKGRSIMIQHDVTTPRPYSRLHLVSGTKAMAQKYPLPERIAVGDDWMKEAELDELKKKFQPAITNLMGDIARKFGGHGGMDFLMDWRTIDCLRNGLPVDMDVYDAAAWSCIGPLSEWSVAHRSNSIDVPDFTRGAWKTNNPVDILLTQAGSTKVIV
ncbi:Gfo/Idh/MocA family oxidoreductase [Paraflavitalea pollutisoli]|uniref:Gfo/Idh/MocA family oxidoreductase n=1 Tax=Paraflavitalea pollutisoli TaxID=3034143 RepID=UPI0023EC9F0D|nr:Gfo/Idh/MocA family oxidoreductase [Paraflavitalea sp. H1-2-19X]